MSPNLGTNPGSKVKRTFNFAKSCPKFYGGLEIVGICIIDYEESESVVES